MSVLCVFGLVSRALKGWKRQNNSMKIRFSKPRWGDWYIDRKKLFGCEKRADVDQKQNMITLIYSPTCVYVFSHSAKCFTAQEEMRNKTGKERRLRPEPASRFAPRCSLTSALWHVAVLNCGAIIWCQVAQRPQTSVILLLCCIVCVRISSTHVFPARTWVSRDSLHLKKWTALCDTFFLLLFWFVI